ncbi:Variable surface protein Vir7-like protein [Plasmodium coatneyi]|uniref:Variable surface protein Vir7-like protein n=1 Tax=Plasmodium coatneyi TaxID=208452 RepID=A0A1B1E2D5_9APIC|nr:Variable surface protein Vir7-like protein [Plasmodium coatneyi]ANQ09202.1 Variable surface protein Vir7-like protein [Plasmodium coatneyi]
MRSKSETCEKLCEFFYYWLGDKLSSKWIWKTTLQSTMEEIYTKLGASTDSCNYISMDNSVDHDIFPQRKIIFDYWHDYKTIIQKLSRSKESCSGKYDEYLQKAITAYGMVDANCGKNITDDFCTEFRKKFKQNGDNNKNIPEPSKLASTEVPEGDLPSDDEGDEANYTSIPALLRTQFGRNKTGRGKRSIRGEFDTFTEGASTFDSSEYSTVATTESTTDGESTIYNGKRPPLRRTGKGRTNTAPNRRNNIGYGRI